MMMKATGIVRKLDDLGRVVIPSHLRKEMGIEAESPLEFLSMGNQGVVIRAYTPGCKSCGNITEDLFGEDLKLCKGCISKLAKAANV